MIDTTTNTLASIMSISVGLTLISISSFGLLAALRLRGLVSNLLGLAIIAYGTIVLQAQVLSVLNWLNWGAILIGHAILAVLTLPLTLKYGPLLVQSARHNQAAFTTALKRIGSTHVDLALLGGAVAMAMLLGAYLILKVPPNTNDSFLYHLSRVAHWLQYDTLHHISAPSEVKNIHPINAEIGLLWLTALWGTDLLTGFLQWGVTILTMAGIFGIARRLQYSLPAGLFAAFIWGTFTIVVAQSTSTKNDILAAFFVIAALYFLLVGLRTGRTPSWPPLLLSGVAFGLAAGTKTLIFLILPALGLMATWLLLANPRQYLPKLGLWALWCGLSFVLLGANNYVVNYLDYGSFFGPPDIGDYHTVVRPSPASLAANLGRIGYQFADPAGLPAPLIAAIQQWRPLAGEKLFAWLNIDPNLPGASWGDATFSFEDDRQVISRDGLSWYGPLGFLLLLPSLLYYLIISPFTNRNVWRWFVAFIAVTYIVAFALLVRWQPYMGRYLMTAVTVGAPLMAGYYLLVEKRPFFRWLAVAIAIWGLAWSATHNFHRPLLGPVDIRDLDYYDLRTIERPYMAPAYRYLDATVPPSAQLGVAGDWLLVSWDYLLFGPQLKRRVTHLVPDQPDRIDLDTFLENDIDDLLLSASAANAAESQTPLWPVTRVRVEWYLASRDEAELFSKGDPNLFAETYGQEYEAYTQIRTALHQEPVPIKVLTTDPRMPYYDQDSPFVFDIPQDLEDLAGYSHLVIAPLWSTDDFARLGLSELSQSELQNFLAQSEFVEKILEANNYELYRILF